MADCSGFWRNDILEDLKWLQTFTFGVVRIPDCLKVDIEMWPQISVQHPHAWKAFLKRTRKALVPDLDKADTQEPIPGQACCEQDVPSICCDLCGQACKKCAGVDHPSTK